MTADGYGQATTIVQRLGDALTLLNPVRLVSTVRAVRNEIGTPPPGDPAALRSKARAYRDAADGIEAVAAEIHRLSAPASGRAWSGVATTSAEQVMTATATAVGAAPRALRAAATALDALAGRVEELQRRHAELRATLREAVHDATHLGAVPAPDPTALDDVARLIRGCVAVYTEAIAAADEAAAAFADVAGQARTAAAVAGGLSPADAVVLAGRQVRIRGIGDGYDDGVLTPVQLTAVGRRLAGAAAQDGAAITALLDRTGSDTERGYLLKAVAAGHPVAALATFADTIRGQDDDWLHGHLSLVDRGGTGEQDRFGAEVDQCDPYTCGTTSLIVARAEADPLYALGLTDGDPTTFDARLTAEQRRVHDATNLVYPQRWGTTPEGMADWLTEQCATPYRWRLVDDTDHRAASGALREVVTAVDAGYPVPVLVGGATPRHYVLAVGHSGDALLIFEPTAGATVRVPVADFVGGRLAKYAGFDHVQAVVLPRAAPAVEDVEFPS